MFSLKIKNLGILPYIRMRSFLFGGVLLENTINPFSKYLDEKKAEALYNFSFLLNLHLLHFATKLILKYHKFQKQNKKGYNFKTSAATISKRRIWTWISLVLWPRILNSHNVPNIMVSDKSPNYYEKVKKLKYRRAHYILTL